MLDYEQVRHWQSPEIKQTLSARDAMLYAVGVGMGQDPLDADQLRYVTEPDLRVLPTMAAVLTYPGLWMRDTPGLGIDFTRIVHGEQSTWQHRPIPVGVPLVGRSRVTRVVDKGPGKGALLYVDKQIRVAASGEPVVACEQVIFCRADGGFSAHGGGDAPGAPLQATPDGPPDLVLQMPTRPEMALIYRLSGDMNPLHSDPQVARQAGFERPILHGLATYGLACHALLKAFCGYDAARLRSIRARFSAPTLPGDAIEMAFWRSGEEVAFRATVPARGVTVLSHGRAVCGAPG